MVAKEEALVAGVEHQGIFRQTVPVEEREQPADAVVHRLDRRQVILHVTLILPSNQRFPAECLRLSLANDRDLGRLCRQPVLALRVAEAGRWFQFQIAPSEVGRDPLLILVKRIRPGLVAIPERDRLRYPLSREVRGVRGVGLPRPVRRLVVHHEEEGLVSRPLLEEIDREVGNHIRHVPAGVGVLAVRGVELRIDVDTLTRQDLHRSKPMGSLPRCHFPIIPV